LQVLSNNQATYSGLKLPGNFMYQPINWSSVPKSQVAELKTALQSLVTLIFNHEQVVIKLGFEVFQPIDCLAFNFAIVIANYDAAIKLGQRLEQIYQSKITEFASQVTLYGL
jgi:hypothetical protein